VGNSIRAQRPYQRAVPRPAVVIHTGRLQGPRQHVRARVPFKVRQFRAGPHQIGGRLNRRRQRRR
ncbi:TPA: hypothetical protein ACKLXQ_002178, partial [Neisseria gonorrhoeae]